MANWESRVTCNETYVSGGADNYSNVTITFQIRRTDYRMNGYNNTGSANWSIACNGQNSGNIYFTFNWNNTPAGTWWTVGTYSFKIPHNSDGSKTISFSAYYYTGISPSSFSASGSATLTKIPRYANITNFYINNITLDSLQVNWTADATCNEVQYRLNNGSWVVAPFKNSFTISGLTPYTTYTIELSVKRSDSGLWSYKTASATTISIATISSPISFDIGGIISLKFNNYNNNSSFLRLYQKNSSGSWVKIGEISGIQSATYNWNVSSYASKMYQNTPNSNTSEVKIVCGGTVGGKEYSQETLGNAYVTNSNPTMSTFTYENTDSTSKNLLGTSTALITYYGNLRVTIPTNSKAVAKNYAEIKYYNISATLGATTITKKLEESYSSIYVDFGEFTSSGTCAIKVEAVDSRGNISNLVTKNITVYKYHNPTLTTSLSRINGFEQEISLSLTGYVSRVSVNGYDKNSVKSLQYRYREVGGSWGTNKTIYVSSTNSGDDKKITYSSSNFLTLSNTKSYEFEFILTDGLKSYTFSDSTGQGIPIMAVTDNKKVIINAIPDQTNLQRKESLIVGSDISVLDSDGKQKSILEEIHSLIQISETEPQSQSVGGIWFQIE